MRFAYEVTDALGESFGELGVGVAAIVAARIRFEGAETLDRR